MSVSMLSATEDMVLLATKFDLREVSENPSMLHYVLVYKDEVTLSNTSHALPSFMSHVLQEFAGVFPSETPSGDGLTSFPMLRF